jgi:O-antigen ligase
MLNSATSTLLGRYVLAATILVTLFVSPWNSIDPVNLPKLTLLGVLGLIAAALVVSQVAYLRSRAVQPVLIVAGVFVLLLLSQLFFGNSDFSFKLYGTPSRNTGFLAYFALTMLLLASVVASSGQLLKKYLLGLTYVGGLLAIYGLFQWRGMDLFDYVNAYGSNVFGTFGNPNFQSAFMGIVASAATVWMIFGKLKWQHRLILFGLVVISILNVRFSSEQGYLNFLAGVISATIVYLFATKRNKIGFALLGSSVLGGIVLILGIFNTGPLADVIYKSSLQARGFYWRAALEMMLANPLTGVGLDGFGNWYRRSRTEEVAQFNAGIVADTAHNIPLDIGSNGGFPLLIAYLALIVLALISIVRIVRRSTEFDVVFASLVAAWVAYQAQSLISINQLGLGVWGWSLTGLLIGYEINTRQNNEPLPKKSEKSKKVVSEKIPASTLLVAFAGGVIGLAVSLPPYLAANKYYKALQSGDGVVLQEGAYLKPYDRTRFLYSAQILADNKLDKEAIQILSDASKIYPDSFELWQRWSQIPTATPEQVSRAKAEMKRLDPFNPDLK